MKISRSLFRLTALGLLLACRSAAAADPPDGYEGAKFGMSQDEVRKLFPAAEDHFSWSATKGEPPAVTGLVLKDAAIGPFKGCQVDLRFFQGKLFRVIERCPQATRRQLWRYLTERYGHPSVSPPSWIWDAVAVGYNGTSRYWVIDDRAATVAIRQLLGGRTDGASQLVRLSHPSKYKAPPEPVSGAVKFAPAKTVGLAGHGTFGVAAADFDQDGQVDLAVSGHGDGRVWLLKGRGDGTFEQSGEAIVGGIPRGLTTADFNGDGRPDVAVATAEDHSVWVMSSASGGKLGPGTAYAAGVRPLSVSAADFNGDGKVDLAVANESNVLPQFDKTPGTVSILLNQGEGKFGEARDFAADKFPSALAVDDADGDGKLDLLVANAGSDKISLLRGRGDGTFGRAEEISYFGRLANDLALTRMGSGKTTTLVIADLGNATVQLLSADGKGGFTERSDVQVGGGVRSLKVADFDGDGLPDVATADMAAENISVLTGDKAGNLVLAARPHANVKPRTVAVADVNRDGRPDLIATNADAPEVTVLLNEGPGTSSIAKGK